MPKVGVYLISDKEPQQKIVCSHFTYFLILCIIQTLSFNYSSTSNMSKALSCSSYRSQCKLGPDNSIS